VGRRSAATASAHGAIYSPVPKIPDDLREVAFEAVAVAHFEVSYDESVKSYPGEADHGSAAQPDSAQHAGAVALLSRDEGRSGDRLGLRPANSDNGAVSGNVTFGNIPEGSNEFTITQTTVHEV
jgi:hypothetical protein